MKWGTFLANEIVLEINMAEMPNDQKGKFFPRVKSMVGDNDFMPFRSAVTSRQEVYFLQEKQYDRMLRVKKIAELTGGLGGEFTIYRKNQTGKKEISLQELEEEIAQFKTVNELPAFRYHPNVYELGILDFYEDECQVCCRTGHFFSGGGHFGESDIEVICIDCLSSGRAASECKVQFNTGWLESQDINKTEELNAKTPGILSWQEVEWQQHCHDFCAYIGRFKWDDIAHLEEELTADLLAEADMFNVSTAEMKRILNKYAVGHLFQCLHCGQHRMTADLP
jgi:uncharacterized protein CbrC (UPF0167 family)